MTVFVDDARQFFEILDTEETRYVFKLTENHFPPTKGFRLGKGPFAPSLCEDCHTQLRLSSLLPPPSLDLLPTWHFHPTSFL